MNSLTSKRILAISAILATAAFVPFASASYIDAVLDDGPVAYYRMDEESGTTAFDEADATGSPQEGDQDGSYANGPTLDQTGAPINVTGNAAVSYDGNNDHLAPGTMSTVLGDSFTVEFWFNNSRPDDTSTITGYMYDRNGTFQFGINGDFSNGGFGGNENELLVFYNLDQVFSTEIDPVEGQWYHVAATLDETSNTSADLKVYVNGEEKISETGLDPLDLTGTAQRFAERTDGNWPFQGLLDEAALTTAS